MLLGALSILHALVAIGVTSHVLLNKSEVRAAIGWIGLAWLSPYFGAIIYVAFGINRVTRRASRINRRTRANADVAAQLTLNDAGLDPNMRTLAEIGSRVTKSPLSYGNRIEIFQGGDEAYPEMLAAIAKARSSIALATYIFRPDQVGTEFVNALIAASERGVQVRVLVDGIGSGYFFSPVVRQLSNAGILVTRFLHDWRPWRMSFLNLRNHKKLIVVDGKIGFTGGLNLGREYSRVRFRKQAIDDVHFRLDGPVVHQLMTSFAEDWNFSTGEMLDGDIWWPKLDPCGSVVARGINSGPDEDFDSIETVLASAVSLARHRISIVTPYFLPDERLKFSLNLAALRGVQIDLLIPERSDHAFIDWATRAHLSFFPIGRIRCFMSPAPFDHSKLVTVDGNWCAFGSANWDVRSLQLNFEFLVECYDTDTVSAINAIVGEKVAMAEPLTSDQLAGRSTIGRLRDASARLFLPYL
ncbi:phosphatidylserine/phosphatidylglycerophosphate/cardiolipin synthase family protein [Hoeflea sp. TYP-13]|uniref:phosphatidylserine/phosphatidylglycerophosphate/ cardiolipin synthase family protein n=1 Tax=Hoeflea sp. TYP-13 TaxID=3230023 RepID=UPI0034C6D9C8